MKVIVAFKFLLKRSTKNLKSRVAFFNDGFCFDVKQSSLFVERYCGILVEF